MPSCEDKTSIKTCGNVKKFCQKTDKKNSRQELEKVQLHTGPLSAKSCEQLLQSNELQTAVGHCRCELQPTLRSRKLVTYDVTRM